MFRGRSTFSPDRHRRTNVNPPPAILPVNPAKSRGSRSASNGPHSSVTSLDYGHKQGHDASTFSTAESTSASLSTASVGRKAVAGSIDPKQGSSRSTSASASTKMMAGNPQAYPSYYYPKTHPSQSRQSHDAGHSQQQHHSQQHQSHANGSQHPQHTQQMLSNSYHSATRRSGSQESLSSSNLDSSDHRTQRSYGRPPDRLRPVHNFNDSFNSSNGDADQETHDNPGTMPMRAQSEPGAATFDHQRFSAYVNRFNILEDRRKDPQKVTSVEPIVPPTPSTFKSRLRRMNQRQLPSPDSRRASMDRRQSPSPVTRQPLDASNHGSEYSNADVGARQQSSADHEHTYNQGVRASSQHAVVMASSPHQHSQHILPHRTPARYSPVVKASPNRSRSFSGMSKDVPASPYAQSYPSPLPTRSPARAKYLSAQQQQQQFDNEDQRGPTVQDTPTKQDALMRLHSNIETPPPANVRRLKNQLWDHEEMLQVAVPPTLHYNGEPDTKDEQSEAQTKSKGYYPTAIPEMAGKQGQRTSQPVSPGRHTHDDTDESQGTAQRFKSKFYEAAIAARLRGTSVVVPSQATDSAPPPDSEPISNNADTSAEQYVQENPRIAIDQQKHRAVHRVVASTPTDSPYHQPIARSASERSKPFDERSERTSSPVELQQHVAAEPRQALPQKRQSTNNADRGSARSTSRSTDGPKKSTARSHSHEPRSRTHQRKTPYEVRAARGVSVERSAAGRSSASKAYEYAKAGNYSSEYGAGSGASTRKKGQRSHSASRARRASWGGKNENGATGTNQDAGANFHSAHPTGNKVASLLARLNAVNREDPQAALAAIDTILRDESKSSSGEPSPSKQRDTQQQKQKSRSQPLKDKAIAMGLQSIQQVDVVPTRMKGKGDDDDDASSGSGDETTVSSLTNPSFQSKRKSRESVQIVAAKAAEHEDAFGTPFHAMDMPGRSGNVANGGTGRRNSLTKTSGPSTASFRKPRPSSLKNYSSAQVSAMTSTETNRLAASCYGGDNRRKSKSAHSQFSQADILMSKGKQKQEKQQQQQHDGQDAAQLAPVPFAKADSFNNDNSILANSEASPTPPPQPLRSTANEARKSSNPFDGDSVDADRNISQTNKGPIKQDKLDDFMKDSDALAKQIQVWDEMSSTMSADRSFLDHPAAKARDSSQSPSTRKPNGSKPNSAPQMSTPEKTMMWPSPQGNRKSLTPGDAGARPPKPPPSSTTSSNRRQHPWDDSVPPHRQQPVDLKDTSMDEGHGMEAALAGLTASYDAQKASNKPFPRSSSLPSSRHQSRSPSSRDSARESDSSPMRTSVDTEMDFTSASSSSPMEHGWDVTPGITPQQQEKQRGLADSFDAQWVSHAKLPTFLESNSQPKQRNFTEENVLQPQYIDRTREEMSKRKAPNSPPQFIPYDLASSSASNSDGVEISLATPQQPMVIPLQQPKSQTKPLAKSKINGRMQRRQEKESPKPQKEQTKRRGFLRAFMRKDKKKDSSKQQQQQRFTSEPNTGREPLNPPQTFVSAKSPTNFDAKEMEPPRRGRNNRRSSSGRSRSHSLERFRSAKIGRVLRMYGND